MLMAPGLLPAGWKSVRDFVVLPWFREAVLSDSPQVPLRKKLEAAGLK
jgi:hypothetical protein